MPLATYGRKHWLHKAFWAGYEAHMRNDDFCPYVGLERDWWWAGWDEAIPDVEAKRKRKS